jgi:hypothetical protein
MPRTTRIPAIDILSLIISVMIAGCSPRFASPGPAPSPSPTSTLEESIASALAAYSRDVSSGSIKDDSLYSGPMKALVEERRNFYNEYFSVGLHSELLWVASSYEIRAISANPANKKEYRVQAVESLHFRARYRYSAAEGYPAIEAARWAIAHTNDTGVQKRLAERIDLLTTGLVQSIQGYDVDYLFVEHQLLMTQRAASWTILQDAFTDANPQDNPAGTDVIQWENGTFRRIKPDFTRWEGYWMYHTSIEELGQTLLNDYLK